MMNGLLGCTLALCWSEVRRGCVQRAQELSCSGSFYVTGDHGVINYTTM